MAVIFAFLIDKLDYVRGNDSNHNVCNKFANYHVVSPSFLSKGIYTIN
nr:MAG TPA: hypothetical protein [Caudoviricetes sp.]DAU29670.1 MAG TPA: hypothetical protein [Herelleviridae sp.]